MSMNFPYGNKNSAGSHLYGAAVFPTFPVNYNQYFPPIYSNSNGLVPLLPSNSNGVLPIPKSNFNGFLSRPNSHCNGLLPISTMEKNKISPLMSKNFVTNLPLPSSLMSNEEKDRKNSNDFLTFIEEKTKPVSELNPFANEFSLVQNTKITNEDISSHRLILDNLIEKSIQSIEAIKNASKTISVNHVAIQCQQSIYQINRSTQTNDHNNQYNLLEEYSLHSVKLINDLLENYRYLFLLSTKNDLHNQLKNMSNLFDELHYLIDIINQIITSNKSSMNRDNLFSNMIKDLSIPSSPIIFSNKERTCRLISSTPLAFSRQSHPITIDRSKLCLSCQKSVNNHEDGDNSMHKSCQLLSSPPLNSSFDG